MRIAVSGSHRCGKSTLVADLAEALQGHRVIEEPYRLTEEEGHAFADPPSLEDFVAQLRRSLAILEEDRSADLLLDRCPADLLAYLLAHEEAEAFDVEEWLPRVRSAFRGLDVVVHLPIEQPDRIPPASGEDAVLRSAADHKLAWILLDDPFDLQIEVVTVEGSRRSRAKYVLDYLGCARRR